jgi:transglutaminase-like putative cysteine protease
VIRSGFILLGGLIISLFSFTTVYAASDYSTSYHSLYKYDDSGHVQVTQQISLTNKYSYLYPVSYQLLLQGETPGKITGFDTSGPLNISTISDNSGSAVVNVKFNDQSVGKGNTLNFTLNYAGKSAYHRGQIWEISLPRLGQTESVEEYRLDLQIPPAFGRPAYISPSPSSVTDGIYTFYKNQLLNGVVAAFGDFQVFGFNLTYDLENLTNRETIQSIALPPDTSYQKVFYDSIKPLPLNVVTDEDGNWLAQYRVSPKSSLRISAVGQAHLLAEPAAIPQVISSDQMKKYLSSSEYWPVDDPQIKQLAAGLGTPENIYNYVVSHLNYDYSRVQSGNSIRLGALEALRSPDQNTCTEFTDLFITLARAAGIPAREINGFAYTTNPRLQPLSLVNDVLHAWPEYWDSSQNVWISIDPTWGKTTGGVDYFHKFDLEHFAFVIHGYNASQPLAAGLYKRNSSTKDVRVEISEYRDYPFRPLEVSWHRPWQIFPFISNRSSISIANSQGQSIYLLPVSLSMAGLTLDSPSEYNISLIPPFGHIDLPANIKSGLLPRFTSQYVAVNLGGQNVTYKVTSQSFIAWYVLFAIIISLVLISVAFLAVQAWSVSVQGLHRSDSLRRQSQKP